jgi:hypothetical protein
MAKLKQGKLCPLIGEDCRELECSWWTCINGVNPQTGETVSEWGCAVQWMPILQVDTTKVIYQNGAAVESFRNATVEKLSPIIPMQPQKELFTINPEAEKQIYELPLEQTNDRRSEEDSV